MKIVCYAEPTEKGLLLHYPSKDIEQEMVHLWEKSKDKYNGYLSAELKTPYKSRTTGKGSQNNKFWLLVDYICKETGEDMHEIEKELKEKAIAKGYPYHLSKITGRPVPESMTKINTVEMSCLIETALEVCAFLGIVLEPEISQKTDEKALEIF